MKGTILDFVKLATENSELAGELVQLAAKHDFEFSDEVSDQELEGVAGGAAGLEAMAQDRDQAIWEAEQTKSESLLASQKQHIDALADMIRQMNDTKQQSLNSTNTNG